MELQARGSRAIERPFQKITIQIWRANEAACAAGITPGFPDLVKIKQNLTAFPESVRSKQR